MRRKCNLELQLLPASSAADSGHRSRRPEPSPPQQQPQAMTIFYDGKVCVTDVTEFQARAILFLASREAEEIGNIVKASPTASEQNSPYSLYSPATTPAKAVCSASGMSMKRSLQQFLQKRRNRVAATTPYHR